MGQNRSRTFSPLQQVLDNDQESKSNAEMGKRVKQRTRDGSRGTRRVSVPRRSEPWDVHAIIGRTGRKEMPWKEIKSVSHPRRPKPKAASQCQEVSCVRGDCKEHTGMVSDLPWSLYRLCFWLEETLLCTLWWGDWPVLLLRSLLGLTLASERLLLELESLASS